MAHASFLDLKKLCNTQQEKKDITSTFSGMRLIGVIDYLKRFDKIPKAFSTTLRALLNLYFNILLSELNPLWL